MARAPNVSTFLAHPFWIVGAGIDVLILALLFSARTKEAIVSPWDVLSWRMCVLYGIASFFHTAAFFLSTGRQRFILLFHSLPAWCVLSIVYVHGFGFDPIVHQAAERHLVQNGFLLPATMLYRGQYGFVTMLSSVTHLPVALMDRWLVPLFSLILIAATTIISRKQSLSFFLVLFLTPIAALTFTIPFHFGVVLLIASLPLLPDAKERRIHILLWSLVLLALVTHPLIGIPFAILVLYVTHVPRIWLCLMIPALFLAAFGRSLQFDPESFSSSLSALFGNPTLWSVMFILIGLWSYKKYCLWKEPSMRGMLMIAIGCFLSAIILALFVRLPDIISHEQFEFPLRLLSLLPIFFIPAWTVLLDKGVKGYLVASTLIALLMTASWYLSYPRNDGWTAPSMSDESIRLVREIEQKERGRSYAVLSPQMVSAAALQEFGFERTIQTVYGPRYFYAIPTGGELYTQYLYTLQQGITTSTMREAFHRIFVDEIVFVVPTSSRFEVFHFSRTP
ncbi:hypothetical protein FJZ48_03250 [Candidatus Uhrbacteria bacterium]|nr:hypothetical protein [Candidatus Uhrbacteria bacterium]